MHVLPTPYVRAYVRRNKKDATDAAALLEAARVSDLLLVRVKSIEQQASTRAAPHPFLLDERWTCRGLQPQQGHLRADQQGCAQMLCKAQRPQAVWRCGPIEQKRKPPELCDASLRSELTKHHAKASIDSPLAMGLIDHHSQSSASLTALRR